MNIVSRHFCASHSSSYSAALRAEPPSRGAKSRVLSLRLSSLAKDNHREAPSTPRFKRASPPHRPLPRRRRRRALRVQRRQHHRRRRAPAPEPEATLPAARDRAAAPAAKSRSSPASAAERLRVHCSADLHNVLDCNEQLVKTCPADQGCGRAAAASPRATAPRSTAAPSAATSTASSPARVRDARLVLRRAPRQHLDLADQHHRRLRRPDPRRRRLRADPVGNWPVHQLRAAPDGQLPPGQVAILFLSATPRATSTRRLPRRHHAWASSRMPPSTRPGSATRSTSPPALRSSPTTSILTAARRASSPARRCSSPRRRGAPTTSLPTPSGKTPTSRSSTATPSSNRRRRGRHQRHHQPHRGDRGRRRRARAPARASPRPTAMSRARSSSSSRRPSWRAAPSAPTNPSASGAAPPA